MFFWDFKGPNVFIKANRDFGFALNKDVYSHVFLLQRSELKPQLHSKFSFRKGHFHCVLLFWDVKPRKIWATHLTSQCDRWILWNQIYLWFFHLNDSIFQFQTLVWLNEFHSSLFFQYFSILGYLNFWRWKYQIYLKIYFSILYTWNVGFTLQVHVLSSCVSTFRTSLKCFSPSSPIFILKFSRCNIIHTFQLSILFRVFATPFSLMFFNFNYNFVSLMFNVYFENRKSSIIFPCQLLGCEIAKKYVKFISQPSSFEITNLFQSSYLDSTFSFLV